jgi:hypothetical protein
MDLRPARVRAQVRSCGICGGQSGTGAGFLRVLRFPLPILIPPTAPHSSPSIIWVWYSRPSSGRRTNWTQSTKKTTSCFRYVNEACAAIYEELIETAPGL